MKSPRHQESPGFELEPGWALYRQQDGTLTKVNLESVTAQMLEAADEVEDLYKRGTPQTWGAVFRSMLASADRAPAPVDAMEMERRLRWVLEHAQLTSSPRGENHWAIESLTFDAAGDIARLQVDDKFQEILAAIDAELTPAEPDSSPSSDF